MAFFFMANGFPPIAPTTDTLAIILPSWVGDTVMATPVLRAARCALPGARIIGACRPGLDQLLAGVPWLDEVIAVESKRLGGSLEMARRLRGKGVTAALLLPNSFRSGLIARLSGAGIRVGYRRSARGPLLSHGLSPAPRRSPVAAVAYYARLAEFALGLESIDTRMELSLTRGQRDDARGLLEGVARPFTLLCPGANKPAKRWPAERFAAVAETLAARHGLSIVATGSPAERSIIAAVRAATGTPVVDLADRGVTLGGLKGVIAEAQIMITNDTGPRHIAAALDVPVVTLFGPTDPRWTTIDFAQEKVLVAEPFLPQELTADDHRAACTIERITVGDVLSAAEQLLVGSRGQAPAARDAGPAPTTPDPAGTR